jgi:hypothetical protein
LAIYLIDDFCFYQPRLRRSASIYQIGKFSCLKASVNFNGWLVRFLLLTDQWDVSAYEVHMLEAARRAEACITRKKVLSA